MSHFIEFEGKNVEQAVIKACKALSIPRDQLKHEVVSFGATGIFGLVGIKKARIRVAAGSMPDAETAVPAPPEGCFPLAVADTLPSSDENSDPGHETREQRVHDHGVPSDRHHPQDMEPDDSPTTQPILHDNPADVGRLTLQRLVDSVTSGAEITVHTDSRQILYTISGGDPAALIGKNGQTLEAMAYLLKKIVNKSAENRMRIVVDIAGHDANRQNDLQELAVRFAEKACRNGKCITIGRFNPRDRKIIHVALKNDCRVKTLSKGEGYLKKLVVMPRRERLRPDPP